MNAKRKPTSPRHAVRNGDIETAWEKDCVDVIFDAWWDNKPIPGFAELKRDVYPGLRKAIYIKLREHVETLGGRVS